MNIQKPTLIETRFFPFEISDSFGVDEGYRVLHWHQEFEICRIKSGTGQYLINGIDYSFEKDDIFVISNNDIHLCHDDQNLVMQVLMFDPSFIHSDSADPLSFENIIFLQNSRKIDKANPFHQKLSEIILQIENEYLQEHNGYQLMIKSLLLQFIAWGIRSIDDFENKRLSRNINPASAERVRRIMNYIKYHYSEKISLNQLAEMEKISVSYLCKSFKKITGTSLINYIICKRITEAKRLLKFSEKSILDISIECGFPSISNFNNSFKKLVGYTPYEYRLL